MTSFVLVTSPIQTEKNIDQHHLTVFPPSVNEFRNLHGKNNAPIWPCKAAAPTILPVTGQNEDTEILSMEPGALIWMVGCEDQWLRLDGATCLQREGPSTEQCPLISPDPGHLQLI